MGLVRRTPSSRKDYRAIWDYVALDSPDAADRLLRTFDAKIQFLSDFPHAGRRRPELRRRLRGFPVGNYVIFYRPVRGGTGTDPSPSRRPGRAPRLQGKRIIAVPERAGTGTPAVTGTAPTDEA